jgi:autotransporter-associated beta strand protein
MFCVELLLSGAMVAWTLCSFTEAAPMTYFGLDASKEDLTHANAARLQFVATLNSYAEETLEALAGQADPTILEGTPFEAETDFDRVHNIFAFSVSGTRALLDQGPGSIEAPGFDDWIQFSQPITAFGSYFAQGGDGPANQLTLRLANTSLGTSKDVSLMLGPGAPFLNIFFFGVTDTDPFDRITMIESVDYDGILLDDIIAGFVRQPIAASTWNVDAGGNWSAAANWSDGVPQGVGAAAVFAEAIAAPRTVYVDVPTTAGSLRFDSTQSYTIGGTGALTLDGNGSASIEVVHGSHVIAAPLSISPGETVIKTGDGSLTLSGAQTHGAGAMLVAGEGVTNLNSDAGTNLLLEANAAVNISATQHLARLKIGDSAIVQLTAGTSKVLVTPTLVIAGIPAAPSGKLDLVTNSAIVDYTGDSPVADIRQQILAGRGGAGLGQNWTGQGITSSAAAVAEPESQSVGYAENGTLPLGPYTIFRGQPVDDTSVLIRFTRTGDANLDGVVNDDDATIIGASFAPGVPQPSWSLGDFDYNGFVDDDDVTLLGAFYETGAAFVGDGAPDLPIPTATAVPEPSTIGLAAIMAACFMGICFSAPLVRRLT